MYHSAGCRWIYLAVQESLATPGSQESLEDSHRSSYQQQTGQTPGRWHRQHCVDDQIITTLDVLWNDSHRQRCQNLTACGNSTRKPHPSRNPCTSGLRPGHYTNCPISSATDGADFPPDCTVHLKSGPTVFALEDTPKSVKPHR